VTADGECGRLSCGCRTTPTGAVSFARFPEETSVSGDLEIALQLAAAAAAATVKFTGMSSSSSSTWYLVAIEAMNNSSAADRRRLNKTCGFSHLGKSRVSCFFYSPGVYLLRPQCLGRSTVELQSNGSRTAVEYRNRIVLTSALPACRATSSVVRSQSAFVNEMPLIATLQ